MSSSGLPNSTAHPQPDARKIFGPVRAGWKESTLTRAAELESISAWLQVNNPPPGSAVLFPAVATHIQAARDAVIGAPLHPRRILRRPRGGGLMERALSNLDAAETQLLNAASPKYLLGMMPSILNDVQRHLIPTDARRAELERVAENIGIKDPHHSQLQAQAPVSLDKRLATVKEARGEIVAAMRAARSAALREQVRIRDFRNVVAWTTLSMALVAIAIAIAGIIGQSEIPLCFAPEEAGRAVVVCPTAESSPFPANRFADVNSSPTVSATSPLPPASTTGPSAASTGGGRGAVAPVPTTTPTTTPTSSAPGSAGSSPSGGETTNIDFYVKQTTHPWDLAIIELMGLLAAAVAAALAIRGIRGSSERHSVLVWLAALKLPTGAVTAFLGLMLMRGQFVPGLSALDTSAQILAWALVFGYAQQLFTRLVDQQGQNVLNSVRAANAVQTKPTPP
jgi:hypothetical protein